MRSKVKTVPAMSLGRYGVRKGGGRGEDGVAGMARSKSMMTRMAVSTRCFVITCGSP
jgi:hypothetical protein